MLNLNTVHKRKSAAITIVIMSLLFVLIFFVGLKYLDPPIEFGISLNFGTSDMGMGDDQPTEPLAPSSQQIVEDQEESVPQESTPTSTVKEEVATQDMEDAITIKKQLEAKKRVEEQLKIEKAKNDAIAKKKAEEDAKKKNLDAMIGGISNGTGKATGGEGNDNVPGDKGGINGDPNANGYYGTGGSGSGGDYQLGNRKPISRPKPDYICNEEGLVIVRIEVDNKGRVIKATPGVKGSTNTASCLLTQAEEAALKTTWQPDSNAPAKQIGTIRYRFSLSQ
ncbi:MAG: energy transducer TonB [Lutibacter sp.]|nr:energy transducer TonB [Lutibacter sp.]MDP3313053.1 energy transducer TonB [Lutibacter sp.]